MKTFKTFITEAGQRTERQETEFVNAINGTVEANNGNPIIVKTKTDTIKDVTGAEKYQGRQRSGSEPYTDVQLFTTRGPLNVSMKGPSAPSLAGGGLRGIEEIIPGIGERFFNAAYQHHLKAGLEAGDKVPDLYGKLNDSDKELLVIGNTAMGGPIDLMYIGPMDVKYKTADDVITLNGSLIDAEKYANSKDLYFRLRARREDQRFDPEAKTRGGVPKIYGRSPSRGDSAGRLVITDRVPQSRNVIIF